MLGFFKVALPGLVAVLYLLAAIVYFFDGDRPMSLVWFCFSVSNFGLIWASMG